MAVLATAVLVVLLILKKKVFPAKEAVKQPAGVPVTGAPVSGVTCSCGTVNPSDAKFCATCGKPVAVPGRCPSCGHKNDSVAKFCQGCGKPFDGGEG